MPGKNIKWLKEHYFSDPDQQIELGKGDFLLVPGQKNYRLFLILEGRLKGYIENEEGEVFEIFRSGPNKLVAAYSFFSENHESYSSVRALEPAKVAFIRGENLKDRDYLEFAKHLLPAVVEEIYNRQLEAQRMSIHAQEVSFKLHEAEKLAMLGQMAAGLAHELNNAVGVIQRTSQFLMDRISEVLQEKDSHNRARFFQKALDEGQALSSSEIRKRRRELESRYDLKPGLYRQLAKIGVTNEQIEEYGDDLEFHTNRIIYYFETGLALHDLLLASNNAAATVASVRELGASGRIELSETDLNQTIKAALTLLVDKLEGIELELNLGDIPAILASDNDWIEVWSNLVKNACEAIHAHKVAQPQISIISQLINTEIEVQIRDNGPGVPEELMEKIFQPNVTTKKQGLTFGLGLGLSIVKRIVQNYNGSIRLESEPGKTVFYVLIPTA